MVKETEQNRANSTMLAILLTVPVLIDVVNVLVQQLGLGSTSLYTMIIHVVILVYMIMHVTIYKEDIYYLFIAYLIFTVNFILFRNTRSYILSSNMVYVYLIALPCSIISIRKIYDWKEFLKIFNPFPIIATVIGLLMIMFLDYNRYLVYMDFSYAMLPSVCANYYYSRAINEKGKLIGSIPHFLAFFISLIEIVIFGARATIFFAIIYVLAFEIMRSDKKFSYKIFITTIFALAMYLFNKYFDSFMSFLSSLNIFQGSRLFMKFAAGKLLYSQGREQLEFLCLERIRTMGLEISGFFGDRAYCGTDPYPHNIVMELLMSWGWIIGGLAIIIMFVLIISTLIRKDVNRDVVLFLLVSIFARYFVSGSYVQESKFYLFLFSIIAIRRSSVSLLRIRFTFGKHLI